MGDGEVTPTPVSGQSTGNSGGSNRVSGNEGSVYSEVGQPASQSNAPNTGRRVVTDGGIDGRDTGVGSGGKDDTDGVSFEFGGDSDDTDTVSNDELSNLLEQSNRAQSDAEREASNAFTDLGEKLRSDEFNSVHEALNDISPSRVESDSILADTDNAIRFGSELPQNELSSSLIENGEINAERLDQLMVSGTPTRALSNIGSEYTENQSFGFMHKLGRLDGKQLSDVSEHLSGGDVEVLANLEVACEGQKLSDLAGDSGKFAGCHVAHQHEDIDSVADKAENSKGVLIGLQHSEFTIEHGDEIKEGLEKRGIKNAKETITRAHELTGTDAVVFAETREEVEEVFDSARNGAVNPGEVHSQSPIGTKPDQDQLLTQDELEAFVGTCVHEMGMCDKNGSPQKREIRGALANFCGVQDFEQSKDLTGHYSQSMSLVQQNVKLAVADSYNNLNIGLKPEKGEFVQPTYNDDHAELPFEKANVRVVAVTNDGRVECREASDFERTDKNKLTIKSDSDELNEPAEGVTLVSPNGGENYPEHNPDDGSSGCDTSKVNSADELNKHPPSGEIPSLRQVVGAATNVVGERILVDGGTHIKHGRDGEAFFTDNLFSVKPNAFEGEKNEFPDVPRAYVEVKTYERGRLNGGISTGIHSPTKTDEVTDGVEGPGGVAPSKTRYTIFEYSKGCSIGEMSYNEISDFVSNQPSVTWSDVVDDTKAQELINKHGQKVIDSGTVSDQVDGISNKSVSESDVRKAVNSSDNSLHWRNALEDKFAQQQINQSNDLSDMLDSSIRECEIESVTITTGKAIASSDSKGIYTKSESGYISKSDLNEKSNTLAVPDQQQNQNTNNQNTNSQNDNDQNDNAQKDITDFL